LQAANSTTNSTSNKTGGNDTNSSNSTTNNTNANNTNSTNIINNTDPIIPTPEVDPYANITLNFKDVNWANVTGMVSAVQDQGSCAAGWAFTTTTTIESTFAIRTKSSVSPLSVQYFLDCDYYNSGCMGGLPYRAFKFAMKNGYYKEEDYHYANYKNKTLPCRDNISTNKITKKFDTILLFNASVVDIL
jgi:C1A family cysteine protease